MSTAPSACPAPRLVDLPLWRLLVALHDAETLVGPNSESVELLRRAVEDKLRALRQGHARPREEAADV